MDVRLRALELAAHGSTVASDPNGSKAVKRAQAFLGFLMDAAIDDLEPPNAVPGQTDLEEFIAADKAQAIGNPDWLISDTGYAGVPAALTVEVTEWRYPELPKAHASETAHRIACSGTLDEIKAYNARMVAAAQGGK